MSLIRAQVAIYKNVIVIRIICGLYPKVYECLKDIPFDSLEDIVYQAKKVETRQNHAMSNLQPHLHEVSSLHEEAQVPIGTLVDREIVIEHLKEAESDARRDEKIVEVEIEEDTSAEIMIQL